MSVIYLSLFQFRICTGWWQSYNTRVFMCHQYSSAKGGFWHLFTTTTTTSTTGLCYIAPFTNPWTRYRAQYDITTFFNEVSAFRSENSTIIFRRRQSWIGEARKCVMCKLCFGKSMFFFLKKIMELFSSNQLTHKPWNNQHPTFSIVMYNFIIIT